VAKKTVKLGAATDKSIISDSRAGVNQFSNPMVTSIAKEERTTKKDWYSLAISLLLNRQLRAAFPLKLGR